MINFDFDKNCYSCGACAAVCPQNAIKMSENCLPLVGDACVDCHLCEKVCPHINEKPFQKTITGRAFVGRNRNLEIRKQSSSGGIFEILAEEAIKCGWYVCGCVYDEELMPLHIVSQSNEDIRLMMGSKYVKSQLTDALIQIGKLCKEGANVLFSGTPCQIAAVKNMWSNNPNILCVGVVCHGSIDRDIWKAYLKVEKERGSIRTVTMRDKSKGWLNYGLKFTFEDGTEHISFRKTDGYFLKAFTDGLLERDRCLKCVYKGDQIKADILLGDAWDMENECPELSDQWGLSSIICLTDAGRAFFDSVKEELEYRKVTIEKLVGKNQRIVSPAMIDTRYKIFRKRFDMNHDKVQELCERYEKQTIINRVLAKMRSIK